MPDARQSAAIADYRDERHQLLAARRGQPVHARRRRPSRPPCSPGSHRPRSPPTSPPRPAPWTQATVTAANEITAAICSVDGDRPDAVCRSRGVLAADQALKESHPRTDPGPSRCRAAGVPGRRGGRRGPAGPAIEHQLALDLVHPTPDPVGLTDPDGVVEALTPHVGTGRRSDFAQSSREAFSSFRSAWDGERTPRPAVPGTLPSTATYLIPGA